MYHYNPPSLVHGLILFIVYTEYNFFTDIVTITYIARAIRTYVVLSN